MTAILTLMKRPTAKKSQTMRKNQTAKNCRTAVKNRMKAELLRLTTELHPMKTKQNPTMYPENPMKTKQNPTMYPENPLKTPDPQLKRKAADVLLSHFRESLGNYFSESFVSLYKY